MTIFLSVSLCVAVGRLRLVLNAEGYEYTDLASHGTGLRIVFHSHDQRPTLPEVVRGVMLSVGTHAHINFRSPAVRVAYFLIGSHTGHINIRL